MTEIRQIFGDDCRLQSFLSFHVTLVSLSSVCYEAAPVFRFEHVSCTNSLKSLVVM